jgi:CRISPR-associated protein (TIGR02710 family)
MDDEKVLICTVGGSHQPILKALEKVKPDFVCFICTGRDPETGAPGSVTQITGKGNIIAEKIGASPTLPNIPTQAGLPEDKFRTYLVPADDIDGAFMKIRDALQEMRTRFPRAQIIADYTGGTKSMTAALVIAALENDDIGLQLVTGARADLNRVAYQTEYAISANIDAIRLERAMQPYLEAWQRFAYDEAGAGLAQIPAPSNTELRARLNLLRNLSHAFAAWDRFDHKLALEWLDPYRARVGDALGLHLKALAMLNENTGNRREPLQIYDLWLNAQRRAAQGRYDDAVARVYRLIEWTAQWQLRIHAGLDTADVPENRLSDDLALERNRQGKYQAGLFQAWTLLGRIPGNPAADFFTNHGNELLDHLRVRNNSILAHGYSPIGLKQWEQLQGWFRLRFLPMLKECIRIDGGIRFDLDRLQLPARIDGLISE